MLDLSHVRSSKHLKVVKHGQEYAVYHAVYGHLCLMDRKGVELLRLCEAPRSLSDVSVWAGGNQDNVRGVVEQLVRRQFLLSPEHDDSSLIETRRRERLSDLAIGRQIRVVQLVVTNLCNLRCQYCFEGYGNGSAKEGWRDRSPKSNLLLEAANSAMEPSAAEAYVASAIQLVKSAGNDSLSIQLFGGEPLLNWPTIRHILNVFGNGTSAAMKLSYTVVTNGTLIDEEIAVACKELTIPVIVSFDSPCSEARRLANGKSSRDFVLRGLEILRSAGVRVVLNSALCDATFHEVNCDLVDFAVQHGIFEIGLLLDLNAEFYSQYETTDIVNRVWQIAQYGRSKGVVVTGYWKQIFDGLVSEDRYREIGFQNCSGMGVQLSIEPDGAVFACKASSASFGNILHSADLLRSAIYRQYAMRACVSPSACTGCSIEHHCGGLCLGTIEKKYGRLSASEPAACEFYRSITSRYIQAVDRDQVNVLHLGQS